VGTVGIRVSVQAPTRCVVLHASLMNISRVSAVLSNGTTIAGEQAIQVQPAHTISVATYQPLLGS
jgi:hypothetical protein